MANNRKFGIIKIRHFGESKELKNFRKRAIYQKAGPYKKEKTDFLENQQKQQTPQNYGKQENSHFVQNPGHASG